MVIAVDFDGTIVEHKYPKIGKEIPYAIMILKKLQEEQHKIILWSVREGKYLDDAVAYCESRGLEFYAVNSNYYEEPQSGNSTCSCRKLMADIYIDDRNVGDLPNWCAIYQMIHYHWSYKQYLDIRYREYEDQKPSIWRRIFGRR